MKGKLEASRRGLDVWTFSKALQSHTVKHSVIWYDATEHLIMMMAKAGSSDPVFERGEVSPTRWEERVNYVQLPSAESLS